MPIMRNAVHPFAGRKRIYDEQIWAKGEGQK
jgi:hypothetical protein